MESENNNSSNLPVRINDTFKKGNQIIQKGKALVDNINATSNNIGIAADNLNQMGETFLESKRIHSQTILGLEKIKENHKTINKHIDTEYQKQKQTLDKAENVIDKGLDSGDIEMIKAGLYTMMGTANHNPLAELKNHLDNKIQKDFDDDDFMIEI